MFFKIVLYVFERDFCLGHSATVVILLCLLVGETFSKVHSQVATDSKSLEQISQAM